MDSMEPETFPIVGLGASAGGLGSFKKFLAAIPDNSGMAYILVQHLSPSYESILPEILSKVANIPVQEITADANFLPNNIYVIPENKILRISEKLLLLSPRNEGEQNMPIDIFFGCLAKVHGRRAVGIVLSGTAKDGTLGLAEIKEYGGITFAENPDTASWKGMPNNAIDAGVVDFILKAEDMPCKLVEVQENYKSAGEREDIQSDSDTELLKRIFSYVFRDSGVDFSYYKKPTLVRRINRRMAIQQIADYPDYLKFLSKNKDESESLFQDLLIKVTSFFRDPQMFEEIKDKVLPVILDSESEKKTIRIWIAACATGEEAYTYAICLIDALRERGLDSYSLRSRVQIFATDISDNAIKKARSGIFFKAELESLSEKQLHDYFVRIDGHYRIAKHIRDAIVFSVHNFVKDPPFGRIDLLSCRNVFIYLEPFLQKKALHTFHYALSEKGFLILGKSESIGNLTEKFIQFSKENKIFTRRDGKGQYSTQSSKKKNSAPAIPNSPNPNVALKTDYTKRANEVLLNNFSPPSLIVDNQWMIVRVMGEVAPYIGLSQGKPTHNLLKSARKELSFEIRNALHKARSTNENMAKHAIPLEIEGEKSYVRIEVFPLIDLVEPYYLVIFHRSSVDKSVLRKIWTKLEPIFTLNDRSLLKQRNIILEKELEQSREDMRRIGEEQEASNEELQSANEELLSNNEEMQSINEELETSTEELQSTNEELIVVNRELLDNQEELNSTIHDLDAVIATMREPFLILDRDFRIRKANTSYFTMFDTNILDVEGKHFFEIQKGQWNHPTLKSLLKTVLPENNRIIDEELTIDNLQGEKTYLFNAREIVRSGSSQKRILLAIADITKRKETEEINIVTIKELGRKNEQLDQFVHVASHDLQEPLRKISTFASIITDKIGDLTEKELNVYLEKIQSSSLRMSILIKNLYKYAVLKDQNLLFESTDLNIILTDVLDDFELLIKQKEAKINIGPLPTLMVIPLHINQLFYNLINNALKFSRDGFPPVIDISSQRININGSEKYAHLKKDRQYCEISVKDNGIGIADKYSDQIFTIFRRLHSTKQFSGTGIGLAICKKIVENHKGIIAVTSEENVGTTFNIILPVKN